MGFRNMLIMLGGGLLIASFALGDWAVVLGAPLVFMGVTLKFLDVS